MHQPTRRTFLKFTAAAAVAADFLFPGVSDLVRQTSSTALASQSLPLPSDPRIVIGPVVDKTTQGLVVRTRTGARAVRVPQRIKVWKEVMVGPEVIQKNDAVSIRGIPWPDGSLEAEDGWVFVNIGRRDGRVRSLTGNNIAFDHPSGVASMQLSDRLEGVRAEDGSALGAGRSLLTPGRQFGSVGLRLPDGGFRATRMWIWGA